MFLFEYNLSVIFGLLLLCNSLVGLSGKRAERLAPKSGPGTNETESVGAGMSLYQDSILFLIEPCNRTLQRCSPVSGWKSECQIALSQDGKSGFRL